MGRRARRLLRPAGALAVLMVATGCAGNESPRGQATPAPSPRSAAPATTHGGHSTPAPPPAAPLRAGERLTTLTAPRPYAPRPPAGATDEYRCFLVDPQLSRRTFLTGSQFLPRNVGIVHHAIFYRVDPVDVAEARRLDADAPGDGWTCFGGTGIGGSAPGRQLDAGAAWVAAWAPGGGEGLAPHRHRPPAGAGRAARHAGALQPAPRGRRGHRHRPARHPAAPDGRRRPPGPAADHAAAGAGRAAVRGRRVGPAVRPRGGGARRHAPLRLPGGGHGGWPHPAVQPGKPAGRRQRPALRPHGPGRRHPARGRRSHAPARQLDPGRAQPRHGAGPDPARRPHVQLPRPAGAPAPAAGDRAPGRHATG